MRDGLGTATTPLYVIVVATTILWIGSLLALPLVDGTSLVDEYFLFVFAIWPVLPVAMAFDVGILRQRYPVPAKVGLPLILLSALPVVAPLAGAAYVLTRARIVKRAD